jgi:hypothetical protein
VRNRNIKIYCEARESSEAANTENNIPEDYSGIEDELLISVNQTEVNQTIIDPKIEAIQKLETSLRNQVQVL